MTSIVAIQSIGRYVTDPRVLSRSVRSLLPLISIVRGRNVTYE
jgi:hypothetical protein